MVKNIDEWVKYLKYKARKTRDNNMGNITFEGMIKMINVQVYSGKEVTERIVTIMTNLNNT